MPHHSQPRRRPSRSGASYVKLAARRRRRIARVVPGDRRQQHSRNRPRCGPSCRRDRDGKLTGTTPARLVRPKVGLHAGDAAIAGRPGDRAAGLRADGGPGTCPVPTRRPNRCWTRPAYGRVPGVAGRRGIEAGEFRGDCLAQHHRSGLGAARHDRGVPLGGRSGSVKRRAGPRWHAGHVDNVLDADGNSVQGPAIVAGGQFVGRNLGLRVQHRPIDQHPGVALGNRKDRSAPGSPPGAPCGVTSPWRMAAATRRMVWGGLHICGDTTASERVKADSNLDSDFDLRLLCDDEQVQITRAMETSDGTSLSTFAKRWSIARQCLPQEGPDRPGDDGTDATKIAGPEV